MNVKIPTLNFAKGAKFKDGAPAQRLIALQFPLISKSRGQECPRHRSYSAQVTLIRVAVARPA